MLRGRQVHYVPGWDCHGLPIELKALGEMGTSDLSPLQVRQKGEVMLCVWVTSVADMCCTFSRLVHAAESCTGTFLIPVGNNQIRGPPITI